MSSNKMDEQEERWGKRNKEKAEIQQLYEFNEKHFDRTLHCPDQSASH